MTLILEVVVNTLGAAGGLTFAFWPLTGHELHRTTNQ